MLCLCSGHLRGASWKLPAGQRAGHGPGWGGSHAEKERDREVGWARAKEARSVSFKP